MPQLPEDTNKDVSSVSSSADEVVLPVSPPVTTVDPETIKKIYSEMYAKNANLDKVNQLLALTRELYRISLLALDPSALSDKMTLAIRDGLQLEMAGIFLFSHSEDTLMPLSFAKSNRLVSVLRKLGFTMRDIPITAVSKRPIFKNLFDGQPIVSTGLSDVWGGLMSPENLSQIAQESNLKSVELYPLLTEERFIGGLIICRTISNEQLTDSDRESLKSFADIIAVALDKAYTYRELDKTNSELKETNKVMAEANEKLKTIDEVKSTILSFTSHHLQNPLANIVMGASMLVDGSFGEISSEAKKASVQMLESARHISLTVKMWLKALEFEESNVVYKMSQFDIAQLAESVMTGWKSVAVERSIAISFETDNHPPYTITADESWMRDVVASLIDNAFKMTEKGYIKVKVEKLGIEKIRFSVSDSGTGIDPETLPKLFQKFEKGHEGWQKDIDGTGLGLYICKKIVEEGHNGRIWAESAGLGKGAIFSVEIPIATDI